ncbi:hypothetical protein Bca52824_015380 [Brassica carinata]|uniref:Uncharacterized protein n=1 Tax=Brassica carinata TaxID=52824 RepID=A0A8X8B5M3_BRACI|nr:hypothetical protein Bca52824_015380 [Brassica carinata]
MLDTLIGGYGHGFGHKDNISSGYGFEGHNEFVSHEDSGSGHFDRQSRYDHQMRLPANNGRPHMAGMPVFDEEHSDDEFIKRSRSHHTPVSPHHQQKPHMDFMPPSPLSQPHHNGKLGNGWQGRHEDGYHGGHGQQQHGGHGMQQHGGHGMQQHGGHGMQQHGGHGMQQHGGHGCSSTQHGAHGMKHQDRLMGPQIPPHHVYMNPSHGSGSGRTVMVKASENWRMSKSSGGHHKVGWGSKGL